MGGILLPGVVWGRKIGGLFHGAGYEVSNNIQFFSVRLQIIWCIFKHTIRWLELKLLQLV